MENRTNFNEAVRAGRSFLRAMVLLETSEINQSSSLSPTSTVLNLKNWQGSVAFILKKLVAVFDGQTDLLVGLNQLSVRTSQVDGTSQGMGCFDETN